MDKWKGKIALVTGSSVGIGADLAVALANSGMIVIGLARRVEAVQDLVKKLNGDTNGTIIGKKCDVTNESEVLSVFEWIKLKYGYLDVFVNNAGVMKPDFLLDGDMAEFRNIFDVNVLAACQCIRASVKLIKANNNHGFGHVIVINSMLGHRIPDVPIPLFNVYPASKFALTALNQIIRSELAYQHANIKLTSISPGMVDTDMLAAFASDPMIYEHLPKLNASDVTAAVLYALSTSERTQVDEIVLQAIAHHQ